MSPRLVVVGAPGAGKTTVGRLLADRWGVGFRDTDADVEAATGSTIADLFVTEGEDSFRAREREAVAVALTEHDGVLSLGGGAVIDAGTRAALADHRVVWLRVGLADAASRVGLNRDRPLLLGGVRATLHTLMTQRAPLYAEVATVAVDTDGRSPAEVADAVEAALAQAVSS